MKSIAWAILMVATLAVTPVSQSLMAKEQGTPPPPPPKGQTNGYIAPVPVPSGKDADAQAGMSHTTGGGTTFHTYGSTANGGEVGGSVELRY
ncbi:MAG: hypothetical protein EOQ86_30245 [Mesorhizobium sp.]|uniref:hypothetical protein n=1 Tax=Mesorhizobium sp. TaxID=1871066 RepID=UPI000FE6A782|nr:hypothetical protein [Mesorhizobium sp.]RWH69477.1 MAG: hypothetical protein EOQ85_32830 [Mesorhizobium sp.]RWH76343.1 MAG: hypothetical protein EOQ86_30245 [Mesorhizobium sp.]RWH83527.1 MAG: hypothetical protein EOQ87_32755 [Mesorhizobium sp.]RWH91544.1 MAG: hypothetical protein EOQ88_31770 [Mesorhizobium sp.]RWH95816.1 MAG: hypothetical protein EOQ89_30425 [Mesorhizobium sp.]